MCLERCGGNETTIKQNLQSIEEHKNLLNAVSYEEFNLGPNSTLVKNNFTAVGPILASYGLETYPMISSFPYPPDFLSWMRDVFKNPQPFLTQAIDTIKREDFTGYNVDWEPTEEATPTDALNYVLFLNLFSSTLHSIHKKTDCRFCQLE